MKSSAKGRLLVSLLIPLVMFSLAVGMSPLPQEADASLSVQLNGAGDFSDSHEIDDSVGGDGDACPEPGESIRMPVTLTNNTDDTFTDVTATLSTLTPTPTTIFSDDMETGEGGWTYNGLWHLSQHQKHTPTHAWYYGINGVWNYDTGARNWGSLTSPVIDLTGVVEEATLSFWYWYYTEVGTVWDQKWVEIRINGGSWQVLEQLYSDSYLEMGYWYEKTIDLSGYVGNTIEIRFRFDTIDGDVNIYEGWYIDDVVLTGKTLTPGDDPYITITDDYEEYGDIPAGGSATSLDDYNFDIDPLCPVGHEMFFRLDISSSNGGSWSLDFQVAAGSGITVTPTSGLVTTEAGNTAEFYVALKSMPVADVTIGLSSSDTTEGTVSPSSLTFNSANWYIAQTVTVTGIDDDDVDDDITYQIITAPATSSDPNYNNLDAPDVSVTNKNDDPGITVTLTSEPVTTEDGGEATFTVVLESDPRADVTIELYSSDTTEGKVSPKSITFNTTNRNTPQTVTVTGVDDDIDDDDINYLIVIAPAISNDPKYSKFNADDVIITNKDDDVAGITITPVSGLMTTESGGTATFTMVLNSEPTADVTIGISSSDTSEGTVLPSSLTFNSTNWDVPHTVTVTGVDDTNNEGDIDYEIIIAVAASADLKYSNLDAYDVSVTNSDDDDATPMWVWIVIALCAALIAGGLALFLAKTLGNKGVPIQAYCMKCRKKVEIKNPETITMMNGRPATQGTCPDCGTKVFRIGKSKTS